MIQIHVCYTKLQTISESDIHHASPTLIQLSLYPSFLYFLLIGSKIDELYASLSKRGAEVYVQRSRQLYETTPVRTKLFTWNVDNIEIVAMADTTLHGKDNAVRHMTEIDHERYTTI